MVTLLILIYPVAVNVLLGLPLPLSAFLMIYICVITNIVPSISLIFETPEADLLKQPPRNPRKGTVHSSL